MEQYISRISKLGPDDPVNGESVNTIVEQLAHNIDLLYSSYNSSLQNWNVSEMIFGNMMDYDQTGEKRYVNGGRLDSIEKILSFNSTLGTISFEEFEILNNSYWLRWDIESTASGNVNLVRNILIPEHIRHQQLLIAIKMCTFEDSTILQNERFDIYVNGTFSGTGSTGIHNINGILEAKTLYATYNLSETETSIEIILVRSTTNEPTPEGYKVRISNVFVGLHSLGNDSFALNYPASGSSFIGAGSDINAFYDFHNNSIKVIPSFLINGDKLEGENTSVIVNITSQSVDQSIYYLGYNSSGNGLGKDQSNLMSYSTFFSKTSFPSSPINVVLAASNDYTTFNFKNGNYIVSVPSTVQQLSIDNFNIIDGANVTLNITPHSLGSSLNIDAIIVENNSSLMINTSNTNEVKLLNNEISVMDNSFLYMEIGLLNQPISGQGSINASNNSEIDISIADSDYVNADGLYGFGISTGSIIIENHSTMSINNLNNGLTMHIGRGQTQALYVLKNSSYSSSGFSMLSTSATERKFKAKLQSNIEIYDVIQHNGGPTAFTDVELQYYCTFGSIYSAGEFTRTTTSSTVYTL